MTGLKFCPKCEEEREAKVVSRSEPYTVRGRRITVQVTTEACGTCGQNLGSDQEDQRVLDAVNAEYRKQEDLLTPDRIAQFRKRYRLSQKSFATLLGMSEATINRYEQGALQEQSHDTAIRACEDPVFVRNLLTRRGNLLSDWQRKRAEEALAGLPSPSSNWDDLGVNWICMPEEVSERTGFRRFDYGRFAWVVIQLCQRLGSICTTVMNKLLFYSDFLNYKTETVSLTGAAYRKLDLGPALADYDGLLNRMESDRLLVRKEVQYDKGYTGYFYQPGANAHTIAVQLTPHEQRVLDTVAETFREVTAKEISERSHKESAYQNTPDRQLISYLEAETLSLSLPD